MHTYVGDYIHKIFLKVETSVSLVGGVNTSCLREPETCVILSVGHKKKILRSLKRKLIKLSFRQEKMRCNFPWPLKNGSFFLRAGRVCGASVLRLLACPSGNWHTEEAKIIKIHAQILWSTGSRMYLKWASEGFMRESFLEITWEGQL